jgi:hypothetical protein
MWQSDLGGVLLRDERRLPMREVTIDLLDEAKWRSVVKPSAAVLRGIFRGVLALGRRGGTTETVLVLAGIDVDAVRTGRPAGI